MRVALSYSTYRGYIAWIAQASQTNVSFSSLSVCYADGHLKALYGSEHKISLSPKPLDREKKKT